VFIIYPNVQKFCPNNGQASPASPCRTLMVITAEKFKFPQSVDIAKPPLPSMLQGVRSNSIPPPFENQTNCGNYRNVFALRWRMKHFVLNLLLRACLNI